MEIRDSHARETLSGRPFSASADCKFCLSNHNRSRRVLRDRPFERLHFCTAPPGRRCLPSRRLHCKARMRNMLQCSPKVTHSSAIMRYAQHREASVSFPSLPWRMAAQASFSMRRRRGLSSLTPAIQSCETQRERFCRGSEVESAVFLLFTTRNRESEDQEEEYSGRGVQISRPCRLSAREADRREPKLSAKLGQHGKDGRGRGSGKRSTCLHVRRGAAAGATLGARGVRRDRSITVD